MRVARSHQRGRRFSRADVIAVLVLNPNGWRSGKSARTVKELEALVVGVKVTFCSRLL